MADKNPAAMDILGDDSLHLLTNKVLRIIIMYFKRPSSDSSSSTSSCHTFRSSKKVINLPPCDSCVASSTVMTAWNATAPSDPQGPSYPTGGRWQSMTFSKFIAHSAACFRNCGE